VIHSPSSLRRVLPLVAALALGASTVEAQVINRPQRGFRGLFGGRPSSDPNRTRQTVVFSANALGGYDDNAGTGTDQPGPPGTPAGPGYTGVFDVGLRYERGRADRTFFLGGLGSLATYHNVSLPSGSSGGLEFGGHRPLGRRTTLAVDGGAEYATQLQIAQAITGGADPELQPTSPSIYGLGDRPSWHLRAAGALTEAWNRRQSTQVRLSYDTTQYSDDLAGDNEGGRIALTHSRQMTRSTKLQGTYDYGNTQFGLGPGDPGRPLLEHRISGGVDVVKRLDPRRTWTLLAEAGALRVESSGAPSNERYQIWTPFVEARTQVDVSDTWYLFGSYQRAAETVPGLEGAAAEAYITDTVNASLAGLLSDRVDLVLSGGLAAGSVGGGSSRSHYRTTGGSVQIRVALTRSFSVVTSYHHYQYEFTDTILPEGFPPSYNRNAIRVGLALWLPLYGAYTDR
jgi:hypothetical protein